MSRKIAKIVLFMTILYVLLIALSKIFLDDSNYYSRTMLHDFYEQKDIDMAFLGASRTYRHFDTRIFDRALEKNTFNFGTSSQRPEDSYYLLKEVINKSNVKEVVIDVTYLMYQDFKQDSSQRTYLILDYLKPTFNKLMYSYHVLNNPIEAFTSISLINRYRKNIYNPQNIINTISNKMSKSYNTFEPVVYEGVEKYIEKGFVYSYEKISEYGYDIQIKWNKKTLLNSQVNYLIKMIELCKKEKIDVYLITSPYHKSYLENEPNYQKIHDFFMKIANRYDVPYWDFVYLKENFVKFEDNDYKDAVHLNGIGAEKFSTTVSELIKKYNSDENIETYFIN